jgi:hypothetical protein
MARSRAGILALAAALGLLGASLGGCGGGSGSAQSSAHSTKAALAAYLREVEPVRLAVNRLLEGADPILSAYRDGRLSPSEAARRMEQLERRFAAYTVDVAAIEPSLSRLRSLNAIYAHTYVLEDAYLSALVSGLAERDLHDLPDTQAAQRAAIIQWRTGVTVLAHRVGLVLPGDLQAAGRGEIAPSASGS